MSGPTAIRSRTLSASAAATCVAVVLLTGAVGCGRSRGPGDGRTEISLFTWVQPDEAAVNQELIREFEREHPRLRVRLINDPSQRSMDKLQTMFAAGEPPDVMSIHGAYFVPLAAKGALLDLEPVIEGDPGFNLPDFYPGLLDLCRYRGKLYSLPRYASVYVMFYNMDLFDAAGVVYPKAGWTWDDYLAAAKRLTVRSDDPNRRQYGCIIDFWGSRLYPWIWQNGGQILNDDRSRCLIDQPQAVEALQFLVDLRDKHQVAAPSDSTDRNMALDAFKAGHIGMYMTGAWDIQTLQPVESLRWGVAPLPRRRRQATLLGTENYAIAARTKHPRQAWRLMAFLLRGSSQQRMAERLEKQPSRRSVAEGPYSQGPLGEKHRVFVDALGYAVAPPNIAEWDRIGRKIQDQMDLIWVGKIPVAQGCRAAAAGANRELAAAR
jgi:multiple sugar transport system substrate-binding protein